MKCKNFQDNLLLYLYDELPGEERAAFEAHRAECAHCRQALEETRSLHQLLGQRPAVEPSPELLVEARQQLEEALDREEFGWRGLLRGWFQGVPALHASRAASVLTILVLGFGLGWTLRPRVNLPVSNGGFVGADLGNITSISQVTPDPQTGEVRITLDTGRRVTLEGSLDDPRIRQVLQFAVRNYDNPGIRRDTLDALLVRGATPEVRRTLVYAMLNDPNDGVRYRALDAVRELGWSPEVRDAFLELLKKETNLGVRIGAVDFLVENADFELLPALRELATQDASFYVRMQCTKAVRDLSGEEF